MHDRSATEEKALARRWMKRLALKSLNGGPARGTKCEPRRASGHCLTRLTRAPSKNSKLEIPD